jgi:hypothetical protein
VFGTFIPASQGVRLIVTLLFFTGAAGVGAGVAGVFGTFIPASQAHTFEVDHVDLVTVGVDAGFGVVLIHAEALKLDITLAAAAFCVDVFLAAISSGLLKLKYFPRNYIIILNCFSICFFIYSPYTSKI